MKILIAADMEGVTGVTGWDQVDPQHTEYQRFRQLMTDDVNAAIRGAYEGGAAEVVVADGHNNGRNILIEKLDARARLNSGSPSPLSMVQGAEVGFAGAMFVGYHARTGAENAILDHTWSDRRVKELRINDREVGETGFNAAVCGHFGVPVIMLSGDQTVCAEARELLGPVETVAVKKATGRMAAECLPPAVTGPLIAEAARRAVERLKAGDAPAPFCPPTPLTLAVTFNQSEMADAAMLYPGISRLGRQIKFTVPDAVQAYFAFRTVLALAQ